jgi:4-hydroxymandelate oxidase
MPGPINLHEYESLARECSSQMVFNYYAGGANDEVTVAENRRAWERLRLRPRVLVDVSRIDIATTVLGQPLTMPVLTAPCGFNVLAHPDGECAVARATAAAGIIQVVSTLATKSFEEIAGASGGQRWFQLYCYRDRAVTRALVQAAEAAGFAAVCLTVDVPVLGRREREIRDEFHLPAGITMANLAPFAADHLSAIDHASALATYAGGSWDDRLTWDVIDWLRAITKLPVVLKGILTAEDARRALEHDVAGIIVSNHGGRQLDGAIPTCEALPEVVEAVGGRVEVLVDGGIRRGTDVVKALALGARAVLIGRPYLWGLIVNGEAGVRHVLELLRDEILLAMALVGRPTIEDIDRTLIA